MAGLGGLGVALPTPASAAAPGPASIAAVTGPAALAGASPVVGGLRFVVLTDTHADVDVPTNLVNLRRVFGAVLAEEPRFVVNCGDLTEYGHDSEYAAYRACVPDALWSRLRHVPGNHESRWDASALDAYRRWFGDTRFSFTEDGIHLVGLDPVQVLQEPGLYGPEQLRWLGTDLQRAGLRTPTLLFQHYPVGGRNFYVNDADALLETIRPFSVRGLFAGHVHREESTFLNGLTQTTGRATKGQPLYYVVERASGADGADALLVTRVLLPPADQEAVPAVRERVAVVPLGRRGPGDAVAPARVDVRPRVDGSVADVVVAAPRATVAVAARIHPQGVFGGTSDAPWTPLVDDGRRFTAALPTGDLAAGRHRVQVRLEDASGAGWEVSPGLDLAGPADGAQVVDEREVGGRVQGALTGVGDLVVVASTSGTVTALGVDGDRLRRVWTATTGPVHRGAAATADGATVLVASADRHLHALAARSGRPRWASDLGSPALGAPLVGEVDGEPVVLVVAGERLVRLDLDGRVRWEAPVPVVSAGRPACDGEVVVVGAGDGTARGYDARTGAALWSFSTNTRTTAYSRLIYGPWDDTVELLPDGGVLVSTVTDAWSLDRATGAVRWRRPGGYLYAPGLLLDPANLLLVDEWGRASLLDPATGTARWTATTAPRVLNAGPVATGDGAALVVGTGGLLVQLDLATGAAAPRRQLFTANTFSTPVLVDGVLVVGAQDGVVRAVRSA